MQQFETAVTIAFSHAQVEPHVESIDDAAGVELVGFEIVYQQVFVVSQRADELLHWHEFATHGMGATFLRNQPAQRGLSYCQKASEDSLRASARRDFRSYLRSYLSRSRSLVVCLMVRLDLRSRKQYREFLRTDS